MTRSIHKYWLSAIGVVAALHSAAISQAQAQRAASNAMASNLTDSVTRLTTANNRFGFRLFDNLAKKKPDTNMCLSPTSISQALQMVYNGAAGNTKNGMALALSLQDLRLADVNQDNRALLGSLTGLPAQEAKPQLAALTASPKPQLAIANSLWIANLNNILPPFVKTTQTYYNAQVGPLLSAPNNINAWVAQHTNNKITHIVSAADIKHADAVLVNAVYFKGMWSTAFKPENTVDAAFHLAGGSTKTCKLMSLNSRFAYTQGDTFQMVRLPYQGDRLEMVIVLPKEGTGLNTLAGQLTPEMWKTWNEKLVSTPGVVALPRFKAEFGVTLNEALSALGMGEAFDEHKANFSLLSHTPLYISKVLHKTFIEVNEQGTEAAAATAGIMHSRAAHPAVPPFIMRMDRPFLYAIQDRQTGAMLFVGTLYAP